MLRKLTHTERLNLRKRMREIEDEINYYHVSLGPDIVVKRMKELKQINDRLKEHKLAIEREKQK